MNPRRLVVCLDGTWNSAYSRKQRDDGTDVLKPSNVLKLARSVVPYDSAADREQIVYYDIGVGSLARYPGLSNRLLGAADKTLGGGWGAGFEGNVEDALAFLGVNHCPGDEVFVFGFSRGAATAQAVTRFLDWAGGLPVKGDIYYLPELFREYVVARGARPCADVVAAINQRRQREFHSDPLAPFDPVDVAMLGVWDTVLALGGRFKARGQHTTGAKRSFHVGPQPPSIVRNARQAVAIDEVRYDFRPELWRGAGAGQTLEQRWFAGVHSNVGGGYVHDGLANLAFHWMLDEAVALGLAVNEQFAARYKRYPQDHLYRSESTMYKALDGIRRRTGRGRRSLVGTADGGNFSVDRSVLIRMCSSPADHEALHDDYRPDNVLRYLADHPALDAYIESLDLPSPLPDDVRQRIAELRG